MVRLNARSSCNRIVLGCYFRGRNYNHESPASRGDGNIQFYSYPFEQGLPYNHIYLIMRREQVVPLAGLVEAKLRQLMP